jgi:hypothetical protein
LLGKEELNVIFQGKLTALALIEYVLHDFRGELGLKGLWYLLRKLG